MLLLLVAKLMVLAGVVMRFVGRGGKVSGAVVVRLSLMMAGHRNGGDRHVVQLRLDRLDVHSVHHICRCLQFAGLQ